MKEYILVITNENASIKDRFIHSLSFHESYSEANEEANEIIKALAGMSDFYIYRMTDANIEQFLKENEDDLLPF